MNLLHRYFLLLSILISGLSFGQNKNPVIENYLTAIRKLRTVTYNLQRIDTFATGEVWDNKGRAMLQRDTSDKLFGFQFFAYRFDVPEKNLYDGHLILNINDSAKTYTNLIDPGRWILGSPGGQMIVPDIMQYDQSYSSMSTFKEGNYDVIKMTYAEDTTFGITNHFRLIYLDPATHLPVKVIGSLVALNKKQVSIMLLSEIKTSTANLVSAAERKYLDDYALVKPEEKPVETLVGKDATGFVLNSFEGKKVSLSDFKGKTVLIDFWETWCSPCVKSMPDVEKLFQKYKDRNFIVLGIMSDEKSLESARKLVKMNGTTFTDLVGNEEVKNAYHVTGIPKYFMIDENGKIIFESFAGYEDKMEHVLKEKFNY
jgi:thiol-disulfide isomerase/thioredoxin